MGRVSVAALAAALTFGCSHALAMASASINFDGMSFSQVGSGFNGGYEDFSVSVDPGQTKTIDLEYTFHLSAGDLAATRDWSFVLPSMTNYSGPAATGQELAAAYVLFDYDTRSLTDQNAWLSLYATPGSREVDFNGGDETVTGTMVITAANQSSEFSQSADATVWGLVFVDANPIPEPTEFALLLAGLALVGFAARRRQH